MHATKTLMDEHQTILRTLACLDALVSDPKHADEPVETLRWITEFLRNYADRLHHGKEEALLFPAMEARGLSPEQGPTAAMRYEHDQGRVLVRRMIMLAEASNEEFNRSAFAEPAGEFVGLLRSHIAKEDHILFPMATRLLTEIELEQLAKAYEKAQAEDFEAGVCDAYERQALELARRLGVDQDRYEVTPACHS